MITLGQFVRYLNSKSLQLEIVSEIGMRLLYSILKPTKTHRKHEFGILTLYSEQKKCCNDVAMWIDWSISP